MNGPMRLGGEAQRSLELTLGPVAPWHTVVTVSSLTTAHGRLTTMPRDHLFEVSAEWVGPPAPGFPPSPGPVNAHDTYLCEELDDARRLARLALEEFGRGGDEPPDLRELAKRLGIRLSADPFRDTK